MKGAARITEREITARLTRLEEGQNALKAAVQANSEAISQLRQDMNTQFDRVFNLMLGLPAALGFALWDQRGTIRPFESRVREIEEEISQNRKRLHSPTEALRSLGQRDERGARVLKKFNLL